MITAGVGAIALVALVSTVLSFGATRGVLGEGVPGAPFAVPEPRQGVTLIASDTPVDPAAVTCTLLRADGRPAQFGPRAAQGDAYELDGITWHPVAEVATGRDGDSVVCTGAGLGRLQATWDAPFTVRLTAIVAWAGTAVGAAFAALAWSMRRRAAAGR